MRHPQWQERLQRFLDDSNASPFVFGTHDCVTFAAGACDALTGGSMLDAIRQRYQWHDLRSSAVIIRDSGGMLQLVSQFLGDPVTPFQARHGDIVLASCGIKGHARALMVRLPDRLAGRAACGLAYLPLTASRHAWRVE